MRRIKPFEPKDQEYTIVDNVIFDLIMPSLSPNGWKVLCLILRKTRGWQKEWDGISYSQIKEGTGIKSDPTVSKALTELLDKNYVHQSIGDKWDAATYSLNTALEIEVDNGSTTETKADATTETKADKAQKPTIETKDTKQSDSKTKGKETNGDKSPALGPTARQLKAMWRVKRINSSQVELVNGLSDKYGHDKVIEVAKWAHVKGMTFGNALVSIETALPAWGQVQRKNGGKPDAAHRAVHGRGDAAETFFDPATERLVRKDPKTGELVPVS